MAWTFYSATGEELINDGGVSATAASITNDLTVTSGNVVIATAGKGIDFSAQSSPASGMTAELLDHYEEGTFTPAIADSSVDGSGESQGYTTQVGRYTKIGNRVFIHLELEISSLGSLTTSQAARIVGLPFTSNSTASSSSSLICATATGLAIGAGTSVQAHVTINATNTYLDLWEATTGTDDMLLSEVTADAHFRISGHYEVA
jgi:hypothetical protein